MREHRWSGARASGDKGDVRRKNEVEASLRSPLLPWTAAEEQLLPEHRAPPQSCSPCLPSLLTSEVPRAGVLHAY